MKKMLWILLFAAGLTVSGAATVETVGKEIILRNTGAEYRFENSGNYRLKQSRFHDVTIWPAKLGLSYNMPGDKWYMDDNPLELYRTPSVTLRIIDGEGKAGFEYIAKGDAMTLVRRYEINGDSPALSVYIRVDIKGENMIRWINLVSTSVPVDHTWLRLVSEVRNGDIATELRAFPGNPFIEADGKPVALNGEALTQWKTLAMFGSYDPASGAGALVMNSPEDSPWRFRAGISGNKTSGFRGYMGISPYYFSAADNGDTFLEAKITILPFRGNLEELNRDVTPGFVERLKKNHLINSKYQTGKRLPGAAGISIWSDLPHNKIFRDEAVPVQAQDTVEICAARDEGESFQLALKPENALPEVSLRVSPLRNGEQNIPAFWYTVAYSPAEKPWESDLEILGDMPDNLFPEKPVDCVAGVVQPFLVGVRVPESAAPGLYQGTVEILSAGKVIAQVPVKLQVWSFSLKNSTLTAALDYWVRYESYPKEKRAEIFQQVKKMVIDHRGGGRWVASPRPVWDKDGNLQKVDYTEFDRSVKEALETWRHQVIVSRAFMLGFGHVPQKNLFGSKEEILTPLWQKKMLAFAENFQQHLKEKNWNSMMVLDLFDEPSQEYIPMINETVKLLRGVAPEWRFTQAGAFMPEMNGSINFWNLPMYNYYSRDVMRRVRAVGGEVAVYNPSGYAYNTALTCARGAYAWLWLNDITYVYQWVVNCWRELGERGADAYRRSSWIAPGPDGPLNTLRMEATRDGIEDYEYLALLKKETERLKDKKPELAARGRALLKQAEAMAWRTAKDESIVVISQDPALFDRIHREAGRLLDEMNRNQ